MPKPRLSQYENDRLRPSLETLGRLAAALEVPPAVLLPGPAHPIAELVERLAQHGISPNTRREARELADRIARILAPSAERRRHRGA